ncbi:MAG TPA: ABC transporter permease [Vicinamibacteria bacterium]
MDWLIRDLRVALRLLARDRAFCLTAASTLAVCIAANAALFTVVHHVLLRPLPVPDPSRILLMSNIYPKAGATDSSNSGVPDYYDRLSAVSVLEKQALFNQRSVSIGREGLPVRIQVADVTPSYFGVMGIAPVLGRAFTDDEGEVGNEKRVVLSDALWQSQFAGDPGAVGRDLRVDGQPYTIVGVMPRSFQALDPEVMLWRPLAFTAEQRSDEQRHSNSYWNIGRLKPEATLAQAQAQVDALNAANLERFPKYKDLLTNAGFRTIVDGFHDHLVRSVKPTLYLLWGGALFVLLIGCVNVANLALVRARSRLKELATRLALGAGRWQVARQLIAESVALTLIAAGAGLLLAMLALRTLGALDLHGLPFGGEIRLDGVAVLYSLAVSLTIGTLLGLVPVAAVLPANLSVVLREAGRGSSVGRGGRILRRTLAVTQVAFTFVLVVGAGLLLASFRRVLGVDPGFVADRVLTASVMLPRSRYDDDAKRRAFTDEALRRVRALPGVQAAGATNTIPFGGNNNDSVILAEGYQMKPGESVISPSQVTVTPGYFEATGVRLAAGRFFQDSDAGGKHPVVIVDEKLARRFWPGQDPIGRRLFLPTDINNLLAITDKTVFLDVVGVIKDVKLHDLAEGEKAVGAYYFPMSQDTSTMITFALKTAGPPEVSTSGLRAAMASLDAELPLFDVRTLTQRTETALVARRSAAMLSLSFGLVALLLSAVGVYGVLAYLVNQRTREIGIRMALGSSPLGIFDLVLREGLLLVGLGFALGGVGTALLKQSLESQLFDVRATDPAVLAAAAAVLGTVALVACVLPARRAARIDPALALSE